MAEGPQHHGQGIKLPAEGIEGQSQGFEGGYSYESAVPLFAEDDVCGLAGLWGCEWVGWPSTPRLARYGFAMR